MFDPGSGSQVSDLHAGILPNGLFWTAQIPDNAFQVSPDGQVASLTVEPTSPAAFIGHFAEARCTGMISGFETGFSFKTGELTSADVFAELGPERNGVFLGD